MDELLKKERIEAISRQIETISREIEPITEKVMKLNEMLDEIIEPDCQTEKEQE